MMGEGWKRGEVRQMGPWKVQSLRGHTETAHEVAAEAIWALRIYPDGESTSRGRLAAIRHVVEGAATLEALVGLLVLEGMTNLELNGEPLINKGRWVVELGDDGTVKGRYVK